MTPMIQIESRPVITGRHLSAPIFIKPAHVKRVDGTEFVKLVKSDSTITRMLVGRIVRGERELSKAERAASLSTSLAYEG